MKFRYTWVYALPFLVAAYLLAAYEFSWLLVAGLPFIAAALYLMVRYYDFYIEGGSARRLLPNWFPIGPTLLVCAQWLFGAVVFRLAFSWFKIPASILDAGFAAAVVLLLYAISFVIFPYDGPFILFSAYSKKASPKNVGIVCIWFFVSVGIAAILFWMLFGLALPQALAASLFVLLMYCFIAT
ncbi:MAG: hypothetical protein HYT16_01035 [DPANN group archaeon]|nr:hypothetical protein [DPANN group archaeon]